VTKWLLLAGGRRNVEFGLRIEYNRFLKSHLRSVEETCGKGRDECGGKGDTIARIIPELRSTTLTRVDLYLEPPPQLPLTFPFPVPRSGTSEIRLLVIYY
jgi:hypothetical protein